ncbi:MAG TPA: class I SAM-dependent methyltransferase [Stenomitos sp.]
MLNTTSMARKMLLSKWDQALKDTHLTIREGDQVHVVGCRDKDAAAQTLEMEVRQPRFYSRVLSFGSLGMGEAYMDEDFSVPVGEVYGLYTALGRNRLHFKSRLDPLFALRYLYILAANKLTAHQSRIKTHYDLGVDLYKSFLDPYMFYTSGYPLHPDDDLDTMVTTMLDRVCRKLELKPDETVVDLGCGFGSVLIYAAQHFGIRGVGVTISPTHAETAREQVAKAGLSDRIEIRCGDYKTVPGQFDKVVSTGMIEHLYQSEYNEYFRTIVRYLKPGGLAYVNGICNSAVKNRHDPFIQKYIFPGTNQALLSELSRSCERAGLAILDVENTIRPYYYTAKRWCEKFEANRHTLDPQRYDGRFMRMWQIYWAWGLAAARYSTGAHFELLLTNDTMRDHPLGRV